MAKEPISGMLHAPSAGMQNSTKLLQAVANRIRRHSIVATSEAGSGHPTSSLSCAEILSTLFFHGLRLNTQHPHDAANDRFILSKGHGVPALWGTLAESGLVSKEELRNLRSFESELEGHPTPRNPWIDVATGSLGQGLSAAVGMATASRLDARNNHCYVLLGDGELAEGSIWEAAEMAGYENLDHLHAIVDVNAYGQTGQTRYGHNTEVYRRRFEAFGWSVLTVDGHDIEALIEALDSSRETTGKPSLILAKTVKGKGVEGIEGSGGKHGKPVPSLDEALAEIPADPMPESKPKIRAPERTNERILPHAIHFSEGLSPPAYTKGDEVPTRKAYGEALKRLGDNFNRVVALDGEVSNSTKSEIFREAHPGRYIEGYIAEQNMVGMAQGLATQEYLPFVSSFAAFLSRAHDQIRMAGISRANIKFAGSHAGIATGEDGPSQMGLEDLGIFRGVPGSAVFYPADAVATDALVQEAARFPGISYLRLTRAATPVIYDPDTPFTAGGSHTLREHGTDDVVTIVTAGITLFEAISAADHLKSEGISCRVIDLYSVKPVDTKTLLKAADETGAILGVEDHYAEGGLGETVAGVVADRDCRFAHLAVRGAPRSGNPDKLMSYFGIDAAAITETGRQLASHRLAPVG